MTRLHNEYDTPDTYGCELLSSLQLAGFDRVIVESVGLGQSEVEIDGAVDMLLLLVPPGGGDSLQAAKKGIVEAADLVILSHPVFDMCSLCSFFDYAYHVALQFVLLVLLMRCLLLFLISDCC